jgi:hypothetical protein
MVLLAGFALAAVSHGFDGAGHLLLGGEFRLGTGNDAAEFFFHIRGRAFDTRGPERA